MPARFDLDAQASALAQHSYYEATVTRPAEEGPPLTGSIDVDVCVIGAGFAGLSTALECRARGLSVAVLDAHRPGWGASGRNGGQTLVGFAKDEVLEKQLGAAGVRAAWALSIEGVALVRERIERYGIDCDFTPGYLTVATKPKRVPDLRAWMDAAQSRWGYDRLEWLDTDAVRARIASPRYLAGVYDPCSGHLHPLKYCLGLAHAARREGAALYPHSRALDVKRGARPVVRTAKGEVRCRFVVSCCNAAPGGVLPAPVAARIAPIASYIIATEPLGAARADALIAQRAAVCDNNFFLDYFRVSADDRMLFGGRADSTGAAPAQLADAMRRRMVDVFPQLADAKIDHAWGGFVDVTRNRAPDFGAIDPNYFYVQGFSGHGVALTGIAGRVVAQAIAGERESFDLFARLRHRRFPGGLAWRRPALEIGMMYHRVREMF
ncbi:NAD(P)/FAD-dependent oxidoreductase [Paraburkholderia caballeronis]|uniref:Gamma-glutamylputrescine oxidase n=1 Tax=Paraburkholderia caballeronis TaxID=416943 RepID=A0A1H7GA83_9BURK|nr:FAD-binding oxidoreductase [Paraburkholderia caballeronis]PXW24688.1 gamma-glutamylputrescine oxidase [Paraburkholderia caballeronis]PXX00418.1 gamma-glutamylputrescine oxidase [Paraburkholderia caballeronis]RAJ98481.1 gamma-glutamylputrescine oxidase [Paraburkholderia caballeronis]SEE64816.1 gamma-glutamylputrescine oxidase [Paraburkholderia caballeronis]SEK33722.1 gamma-glutamylputrescine oxidase [Paraburkholderia caballeronis]